MLNKLAEESVRRMEMVCLTTISSEPINLASKKGSGSGHS